jgi:hypothetical protein
VVLFLEELDHYRITGDHVALSIDANARLLLETYLAADRNAYKADIRRAFGTAMEGVIKSEEFPVDPTK